MYRTDGVTVQDSPMEVLVFDPPLIELLGLFRVSDADDVEALGSLGPVDHTRDIGVRPVHLLFDVHVGNGEPRPEGQVAEHLDVVAAALERGPFLGGNGWCGHSQSESGGRED